MRTEVRRADDDFAAHPGMAGNRRRRASPQSFDDVVKSWPLILVILALIALALWGW